MARKQQEKSQQTQQELMEAAMELFGSKGYVATSVSEITEHAGYAKGSFYRHWESKDSLFLRIIEQKLQQYRDARDREITDAISLADAMGIIWDFLGSIVADRQWAKVLLEFTVISARDEAIRKEMQDRRFRLSEALFAELIGDFITSDYPPEKIGALNTALFEGFLVHNALEGRVLGFADVRQTAIDLAVRLGTNDVE